MEPPRRGAGRPLAVLAVLVVLGLLRAPLAVAQRCTREPEGKFGQLPRKMSGSGGYGIEMSGNHHEYDPGERYEVKLGSTQKRLLRKFIGFYLTVEPAVPVDYIMSQRVGRFQRSDSLSVRFADECPNMVLHTSDALKSYVPVVWVAPPPGSGCVVFRATVIERHVWFKDDGALSYKLCERVRENHDEQPLPLDTCCACNEAKYEVTFEGLWSRNTHPHDFPIDRTAAAFSDIVGASHSAGFHIWREDGMASQGVRQVAEWGNTKKLENELKKNSSEIRTIIKARGLEYPNLQGRTFAVFRVDHRHHQASLLSRLKPSPDWLVGVSAMELCLHNCSWAERRVLNLRPLDAGTMNGDSYLGSYTMTSPAQKIRRITSKWPTHSPFYDPTGGEIPPLARLVFKRQRTYERHCADGRAGPARLTRSDCATTSWSAWSGCSVTCGRGSKSRHRYYRDGMNAGISHCHVALEETSQCDASIPCSGDFDFGGGGGRQQQNSIDCSLEEWSAWGPCSTSCGPGMRVRNRKFKSRLGRKWCSGKTTDQQDCSTQHQPCESYEVIPPGCEVLPWSDWSPCSAVCGQSGVRVRTREFYSRDSSTASHCNDVKLDDQMSCPPQRTSCRLPDSEAPAVCLQPVAVGDCRNSFQNWYYSEYQGRCVTFTYSGCRGNDNNFDTLEACEETCQALLRRGDNFGTSYPSSGGGGSGGEYGLPNEAGQYGSSHYALAGGGIAEPADMGRHSEPLSSSQVINPLLASSSRSQLSECAVGAWSAWSACSSSCDSGTQVRRRRPLQPERANTAGCGRRRLVKRRHCHWLPRC